jgi:predicted rRNA methylase YqxC with S4 and FtsJ domains
MKLYQKLKEIDLVENHKEYMELIWMRSIKVNDKSIEDPIYEVDENDRIKVGIKDVD